MAKVIPMFVDKHWEYINRLENNEFKNPALITIKSLAGLLGVKFSDLMGDDSCTQYDN